MSSNTEGMRSEQKEAEPKNYTLRLMTTWNTKGAEKSKIEKTINVSSDKLSEAIEEAYQETKDSNAHNQDWAELYEGDRHVATISHMAHAEGDKIEIQLEEGGTDEEVELLKRLKTQTKVFAYGRRGSSKDGWSDSNK